MESNPYQKNKSTQRLELYKQKLSQRNNNQNWILSNYFGKPGGGAPLRDKNGKLITKIKTIADDNIYHLESKEFSKGISSKEEEKNLLSQTFPLPQQPIYQNPLNQSMQPQPSNLSLNNTLPPINNPQINPELYLQQFKNNYTMFPPGFPMVPYYPYPPFCFFPPPYQYPYPYPYSKSENTKIEGDTNRKNAYSPPPAAQSTDKKTINNNDDGYCLPVPKEGKEIQDKETQKILWQKELQAQMEEKKKRDEREKERMIELDKLEEIKYQEYLQIKKEQAEQQEQKRKNKLNKKLNTLNESNDKKQGQNLNSSNNNNQENNNLQTNNSHETPNPTLNSNNQINQSNYLQNEQTPLPENILQQQEKFKQLIDNKYKSLADLLNADFDKELDKINKEYDSKYSDFTKELLNYPSNEPIGLKEAKNHSENRLKHVQDLIEQRNLIDFIFDKPQINLNGPIFSDVENEVKSPSCFGINKENEETKYTRLQSSSTFIGNPGDKELSSESTILVERNPNNKYPRNSSSYNTNIYSYNINNNL